MKGRNRPPTLRIKRLLSQLTTGVSIEPKENDVIVSELIDHFAQYPNLAKTPTYRYLTGKRKTGATPLHIFLDQGRVDNVQTLMELCRRLSWAEFCQLLNIADTDGNLPVHYACRHSSRPVIEFLIKQAPVLLIERGSAGFGLPFVAAMQRHRDHVPFSTLQKMLELYPRAAADASILCYAIRNAFPYELLESIGNVFPTTSYLKFVLPRTTVNLDAARVLAKILSKATVLHLAVQEWEPAGFVHFSKALAQNTSLAEVQYLTLPSMTEHPSPAEEDFSVATIDMLAKTCLRKIHLFVDSDFDVIMYAMGADSVAKLKPDYGLPTVEVLTIESRLCQTKYKLSAISTGSIESSLCFNLRRIVWCESVEKAIGLILGQLPLLTSLDLQYGSPFPPQSPDITDFILAAVLHKKPQLRVLRLFHCSIDKKRVVEALEKNYHLRVFNTYGCADISRGDSAFEAGIELLKHNTTLFEYLPLSVSNKTLQYYLQLNRMGRVRVRNCHIFPTNDWIRLLLSVETDDYLKKFQDKSFRQSILFGLLRENPGLWCHGTQRNHIGVHSTRGKRKDSFGRYATTDVWMVPSVPILPSLMKAPALRRSRRLTTKAKLQ